MKFLTIRHPFENTSTELIQEYYRERFYGWVTLIALHVTLLASDTYMSSQRAFMIILFTIIWLWSASILAAILSHRVVYESWEKQKWEIHKAFITHVGIIVSWVPSLLCIWVSILGLINLEEALLTAIAVSLVRIWMTVIDALLKNDRHNLLNILSVILQFVSIWAVITVKLLSEK